MGWGGAASLTQKIVLDAMTDALAIHGEPSPRTIGLPTFGQVVAKSRVEEIAFKKLSGEPKRRNENIARALDSLAGRGLIGVYGDVVWKI